MIIPKHIAFIMDGNGRWAKEKGLPRSKGHLAGIGHIKKIVEICNKNGVQFITAYVWSTENWARPNNEVKHLMNAIVKYGPGMARELHKSGIKILHCGSREGVAERVLEVIDNAISLTQNNGPCVLNLAFNYGSRKEIVDTIKNIVKLKLPSDQIDAKLISENFYTPDVPSVDLLVRTGGNMRLSNFLLFQCSDCIMHFTNTFWPSLAEEEVLTAITAYNDSMVKA